MDTPSPPQPGLFRRILANNLIDLRSLPVGLKRLTVSGYLVVLGLMLFPLVINLAGENLQTVPFSLAGPEQKVPLAVMAVTGLALILGWAYLLAGAAAAHASIFLPVLALFWAQLFMAPSLTLLVVALRGFFLGSVLVIYGVTFRMRFWRDLPGLHFFGWLGAASVLMLPSVRTAETNARIASGLSVSFGLVLLLTTAFWVVLGFSVIDLGIKTGRVFTRLGRRFLPFPAFGALTVFVLLVHPAADALVFSWGQGACLADMYLSVAFIICAVVVWIARRWSITSSAVFLTLSLASPVVTLGVSLALAGKNFTSFLLERTGLLPPLLLFMALTTYNLFSMGVTFTSIDGRVMPRQARVLLYFGTLILVVACMLFLSNERNALTNEPRDFQGLITLPFALSACGLGIPYVIGLIWKQREDLTGSDAEFTQAPRWSGLEMVPKWVWLVLSILLAGACSYLLLVISV